PICCANDRRFLGRREPFDFLKQHRQNATRGFMHLTSRSVPGQCIDLDLIDKDDRAVQFFTGIKDRRHLLF
uniref:Uncharacterized protein n=1 Tax=Globisporangium ultimum (strain ATCC 200006 / CBS 805.95 / DAOM BR144) TaxID=431595 RepID=K3WQ90_GLOUD